jgi:ribosomal protein S27AE
MTLPFLWRTDDPCPVCGTGLHATDDGALQQCGLCGWSATWQAQMDGGEK